ncbi:release factor [Laetiporus sulphureus 93-53]|uniref:Release factor n=1 Tax=Laetiporus sulphureus 93-53 TaxID=1314785 RepID=A0A165B652_9APHY|nr:release factor [Laetiporus sulphureus 93-53]KZT00326.1 release factor [Laetiporus sulphureus 93-53]
MFRLGLRLRCLSPRPPCIRPLRWQHPIIAQKDFITGLDDSPILKHVKHKVDERSKMLYEVSDEGLSTEDVVRLKRIHELEPLQAAWSEWTTTREALQETTLLLSDADPAMRTLAVEEHASLVEGLTKLLEHTFPALLIPPSKTAHLSALIELKSGVGGSESSLFLADLMRMYTRVANILGWKVAVMGGSELENGGMKDAILEVKGEKAYDTLRWESGVHRVQRVPATESSGRVHTSTVAVVVLPLAEESSQSEQDDLFKPDEVKVEVMRARGAGGQHVNKTESAVRLTHLPTGITVSMQDERSQHQNRRRAYQVLRARLMDRKFSQDLAERRAVRKNLVGSADRSEKIRTYNYVQDRVTDHRLGLSLMNLNSVMEGEGLTKILDALEERHHQESLEELLSN